MQGSTNSPQKKKKREEEEKSPRRSLAKKGPCTRGHAGGGELILIRGCFPFLSTFLTLFVISFFDKFRV